MNTHGYTFGKYRANRGRTHAVVELRYDSAVGVDKTGFASGIKGESLRRKLLDILEDLGVRAVCPLIPRRKADIRERITHPIVLDKPVTAAYAHCGFAQVFPRRVSDVEALVKRLNKTDAVWKARVSPNPVPAGSVVTGPSTNSRNFEPAQGYLHSAPYGFGALDLRANEELGWDGKGVTICDIETGWNLRHEDLRMMRHIGGDLDDQKDAIEHGTAVMGVLLSQGNRSGLVGMVPKARGYVHSAMIDGAWNTAGAIVGASKKLRAGDVIIIELQDPAGPNQRYVAMQHLDEVFSAIRAATEKGITVVEAAGNGAENFDRAAYRDSGLQKDSGAIVVGAGVPPTNYIGHEGDTYGLASYGWLGPPRSRIWFSNYGSIVNMQAWGWHVTTLGYGDAQGGNRNRWYTHRFSGTSSATPIIASAVAAIQSSAMQHYGEPLKPMKVREILIRSGWNQVDSPTAPLSENIGPQPDLISAFDLF